MLRPLGWAPQQWSVAVNGTYEASLALIRDRCTFLSPADKDQILRKTAEAFFFNGARYRDRGRRSSAFL
jgi:hypothetical protein